MDDDETVEKDKKKKKTESDPENKHKSSKNSESDHEQEKNKTSNSEMDSEHSQNRNQFGKSIEDNNVPVDPLSSDSEKLDKNIIKLEPTIMEESEEDYLKSKENLQKESTPRTIDDTPKEDAISKKESITKDSPRIIDDIPEDEILKTNKSSMNFKDSEVQTDIYHTRKKLLVVNSSDEIVYPEDKEESNDLFKKVKAKKGGKTIKKPGKVRRTKTFNDMGSQVDILERDESNERVEQNSDDELIRKTDKILKKNRDLSLGANEKSSKKKKSKSKNNLDKIKEKASKNSKKNNDNDIEKKFMKKQGESNSKKAETDGEDITGKNFGFIGFKILSAQLHK